MNYAYIRVSSKEQNVARQLKALGKYPIDLFYSEKISGADLERPALKNLISVLKSGDTVYIADFSRLARSTYDLLTLIKSFEKNGINLVSDKEKLDMSTPQGKLIVTILSAVNEFEREITKERQAEGIAIAKAQGKYKGGKKKEYDKKLFDECRIKYERGEITRSEFAKEMGFSLRTLYNRLAEV